MAKMPSELNLGERPTPRPAGGLAQYRGDMGALEEPGRAVMRAGSQIGAEGERLYAQAQVEIERADNLRVQDAINKLKERTLQLEVGETEGYRRLIGEQAATRPLLPEYEKKYEDAVSMIAGTLSNDRQKEKFRIHQTPVGLALKEGVVRHQLAQGDVYAKQVDEGTVKTGIDTATANWDKPRLVELALASIKKSTNDMAERGGWANEYRDAIFQDRAGKVHAAVIGQAIATGNTAYAEQWFNKHRDQIDLPTAKTLEVSVRDGEQRQLASGYRSELLALEKAPSMKALEALRARVMQDEKLGDERKNVLVGQIQNQEFRLEAKQEARRARWERKVERRIDAFNANTLAGYPGSDPNRGLELITATKGTPMEGEARAALALANATREFSNQPPVVQAQMLAQAEAAVRKDPTKVDRRVLDSWRQISSRQADTAKANPVGYAAGQGLVTLQPLDLANPVASAAALEQRFGVAAQVAGRYGQTVVKPLQPEEVQALSAALTAMSAEKQAAYFGQMKKAWGSNTQGYLATMGQLASDSPVVAWAGSLAGRDHGEAAALVLRGNSYLNPNRSADGKPARGDTVTMPPLQEFDREFRATVGDAFAGKPESRSAAIQAVRAAYAAMAADKPGEADPKTINMDFFRQATEKVLGGVSTMNGRQVVMPYGSSKGDFEDGVKRLTQAKFDAGLKTDYSMDRLLGLPLRNVGDGRYVFMAGDSVVTDKTGKDIVIDFSGGVPWKIGKPAPTATPPRRTITDYTRDTATQR